MQERRLRARAVRRGESDLLVSNFESKNLQTELVDLNTGRTDQVKGDKSSFN